MCIRDSPDAAAVQFSVHFCDPDLTSAVIDATQIERAVFNLVLNASQAPRVSGAVPVSYTHLDVYKRQSHPRCVEKP